MGGIADYSGSLVLQLPIREATWVAAQRTDDEDWQMVSMATTSGGPNRALRIGAQDRAHWHDLPAVRKWFRAEPQRAWAAYLTGVLLMALRELQLDVHCGWRLLAGSEVPEGKGVSSSAALEVATLRAILDQVDCELDGVRAAEICQAAENHVVGAACGIMDPMACALGKSDQLLELLCQPAEVQGWLCLPPGIGFWGIDSGIRHAVTGNDYGSVRTGAFMGYRMIGEMRGFDVLPAKEDRVVMEDPVYGGYLANVGTAEFEQDFASHLPERMQGGEFLDRYAGITDPVTQVQRQCDYAIRQPTQHPIYEHARVRRFRDLMSGNVNEATMTEMGEMMFCLPCKLFGLRSWGRGYGSIGGIGAACWTRLGSEWRENYRRWQRWYRCRAGPLVSRVARGGNCPRV